MADFQSHITFSTVLGVGYGLAGHFLWQAPWESSLLAAGLCSVSGMLPDLDSDSGTPVREMTSFTAAVIPMLLIPRFEALGWPREMMVLAAGGIYLAVRFGVGELFKKFTVHRGMWHSIPACLACGMLAYLMMIDQVFAVRAYKAAAVSLGFLSHLALDEIWSVSLRSGRLNVKRSFGTAIKFWGKDEWANYGVYALTAITTLFMIADPMIQAQILQRQNPGIATPGQPGAGQYPQQAFGQPPYPAPATTPGYGQTGYAPGYPQPANGYYQGANGQYYPQPYPQPNNYNQQYAPNVETATAPGGFR